MLTEKDKKWLMQTFEGQSCPKCDGQKAARYFLCRRCYGSLPSGLRIDMIVAYKHKGLVSKEFSRALDNAVLWDA